jgi:hypothetical protein
MLSLFYVFRESLGFFVFAGQTSVTLTNLLFNSAYLLRDYKHLSFFEYVLSNVVPNFY